MRSIRRFRGPLFLLAGAFFWGTTFLAQESAADAGVPPLTYNGLRMLLGAFLLGVFLLVREKGKPFAPLAEPKIRRGALWGGAVCGVALAAASFFQQYGITLGVPAGRSAFLTAFYLVLVPIVGVFFGRKTSKAVWIAVAAAFVGMYFLCLADFSRPFFDTLGLSSFRKGDVMTLLCALCFSGQILAVGHFAGRTSPLHLSFFQFLFAGALSLVAAAIAESPSPEALKAGVWGILYAAVFSCAVAYTFQILGQRETAPAVASVIMCMESVFALGAEILLFRRVPRLEEILGSAVLFAAILVSSLADVKNETPPQ